MVKKLFDRMPFFLSRLLSGCSGHGRRMSCRCFGLALALLSVVNGAAASAAKLSADEVTLAAEVQAKGWIAFSSRSGQGTWEVALCRPDGSQLRSVTETSAFHEFSPLFSRDGRKILYRRIPRQETIDNNRHGEQGELILSNRDGSEVQVLGQPGELPWASWSPDGRQIASLSIKGISIVDLATRAVVRTLPRKGFFQQMVWSPDGRWLCGVANSFGASWSIARMEITTGEASAINKIDCCTPDWFPDTRNVIFSWRPRGQRANNGYGWTQLWRADAEGRTRQLVYGEDGRHVYGGHVSPDGRYVLFTGNMREDGDPGNAGGPMGLMRLSDAPIITGESKELRSLHPEAKDGPVLTLPPGWEPSWTLAEEPSSPSSSRGAAASSQSVAASSPQDPADILAAELHSQGWLIFSARTDRGDWDLFLMRPDGSGRRPITHTPDFNEAGARLSPDGRQWLYYRMPQSEAVDNTTYGTFALVIAKADGADPTVWGPAFPWASWSADGRQIACLSPKGIQVVDLATRRVVREYPRHGMVQQLVGSPDGNWFVGTANGLGPFWNIGVLNPVAGEITAVSETERYNCTPDWAPDSQHVVYARGIVPEKGGRAELWSGRRDGQERRRLYAEEGRHIYGACSSPDGRYVVFTRSEEDLGKVMSTTLAIIRWPKADSTTGGNPAVRLDLGPGWEPHWTAHQIPAPP